MQEHRGVKFKVEDKEDDEYKSPTRHTSLFTWHELTQQWIFERSLGVHDVAVDVIDQLIDDGFLRT